jgi:hypothetical protein
MCMAIAVPFAIGDATWVRIASSVQAWEKTY